MSHGVGQEIAASASSHLHFWRLPQPLFLWERKDSGFHPEEPPDGEG